MNVQVQRVETPAELKLASQFAERKDAFARFQQAIADDVTTIKIGDASRLQAGSADLNGYKPMRITRLWNVWLK